MEHDLIDADELILVGITLRTTNTGAAHTIGDAWHKFIDEGVLDKIDHRVDDHTVLGLYTDYESDETGAYTFVLGAPVTHMGEAPDGLAVRVFPAQRFARVKATGRVPEVVQQTWERVYAAALPRSFSFDYERYDVRQLSPVAKLELFVGLTHDGDGRT